MAKSSSERLRWPGVTAAFLAGTRHGSSVLLAAALALSSSACTRIDNALASVPFLAFMRNAPSIDPYEAPRPAPPGAVPFSSPVGELLPPMQGTEAALTAFAASPQGQNPLAASRSDTAVMALGRVMYDRHCMVCHGTTGQGNGPILGPGKFPFAPNIAAAPTTGRPDGYIYAIIRAGRGLMPAYGARTTHLERWAVVNYVRQLQGAAPVLPATLPPTSPGDRPSVPSDTIRQDTAAGAGVDSPARENR